MARIQLNLSQFEAAGVYTIEIDASESIVVDTQTIRMIVGFSRKGIFNAPVFLRDKKDAIRIFGNIDPYLERRGSYFHRALLTALDEGPVYALNLLPVNTMPKDEGGDFVEFKSLSLDTAEANAETQDDLFASFFNKERFWFADEDYFQAVVDNNALTSGKLLSIVNLGQTPLSFVVKKSLNVDKFELTAREFFGQGNVPESVREWDFVSDYFVDVHIVEGTWTNFQQLSTDPVFSQYFDEKGLKKDQLDAFLAADEVTTVGSFTGSLIPDLIDETNANYSLDVVMNNAFTSTNVFVSLNRDALEDYDLSNSKVDLVGHNLIDYAGASINYLSYRTNIQDELKYTEATDFTANIYTPNVAGDFYVDSYYGSGDNGKFDNLLLIKQPGSGDTTFTVAEYDEIDDSIVVGRSLLKGDNGNLLIVSKAEVTIGSDTYLKLGLSNPLKANEPVGSAALVSASGSDIVITGDVSGDIAQGDEILVTNAAGTVRYYFTADTVAAAGNTTVTVTDNTNIANITGAGWTVSYGSFISPDLTGGAEFYFKPDKFIFDDSYAVPGSYAFKAWEYSEFYQDWQNGLIINGDSFYSVGTSEEYFIKIEKGFDTDGARQITVYVFDDKDFTTYSDIAQVGFGNKDKNGTNVASDEVVFYSLAGNLSESIDIVANSLNTQRTVFRIAAADADKIEVGQYVVGQDEDVDGNLTDQLTIVTDKKRVLNNSQEVEYEITTTLPIKITSNQVTRFLSIDEFVDNYSPFALQGFKMTSYHLPDGSETQLSKILGVLDEANSNLTKVLKDSDIITFRYVVDTFDGGLGPQMGGKVYLSDLARRRQKCMALLNAPSIKRFSESTDPRFTELPDPAAGNPKPVLNVQYIADGGNLSLGPSFRFTLPDEAKGAKFYGVFSPFLEIRENNKNKIIPPAADISNNFIRKFKTGQPYSIVAGTRRGVISNANFVGLEYDFLDEDRAFLEKIGINPIIVKKNIGPTIFGNLTGYQKRLSALNSLHVRDLLITIEDGIEQILAGYLFETNDALTRLEIQGIVETYLEGVEAAGGILSATVIMNEKNNTPNVISQRVAIIDVAVEPALGIEKFVNRVTVLGQGGVFSGGFVAV